MSSADADLICGECYSRPCNCRRHPTAAEINALPANLRSYIHDLETRADPAGDVRRGRLAEDENRALRRKAEELTAELVEARDHRACQMATSSIVADEQRRWTLDLQSERSAHERTKAREIEACVRAIIDATEVVRGYVGCGDSSCMFASPKGMATNGGCRCLGRDGSHRPLAPQALARLYKAALALALTTLDEKGPTS